MTATYERETAATPPTPPAPTLRRRRRIALAAALLAALVAAAVWVIGFSSVIGVRSYAVRGTHLVTRQQVLTAADIPHGTPLVRVDTDGAVRRIEELPEVASATVDTSFPSTVVITVVERTPVGYLSVGGGHYALIDRTGAQYREVDSEPPSLPRFVVPTGASGRSTGASVATVASGLPATLLRRLASIQALDPSEITLVLRNGHVVHWGGPQRTADKARVLQALLHRAQHEIDVSNPDQPFTR